MRRLKNLIRKLYEKKVSSTGLAVFRMLYALILFLEVRFMHQHKELIFDIIPFVEENGVNNDLVLTAWMIILVLLFFGAFTRWMAVLNWVLTLVFLSETHYFEYHMHYAYQGINLLLIFIPMSRSLSLDHLFKKLKYSNSRFTYRPDTSVSQLAYYILIIFGVAVVYIDSVFFKIASPMWMKGLGMWLPASLPHITIWEDQWLLNQEWLMRFLGYLVIVFETLLIFTFWMKRTRLIYALLGIGFHLGIWLEYPIPYFAWSVVALYMLMVPLGLWDNIGKLIRSKKTNLIYFYDEECPLCARTKITMEHFDIRKRIDYRGVQSHGFNHELLQGESKDDLLNEIYSIDSSNTIRKGIDTYVQVFKRIPAFYVLFILLSIPGFYHLGKWIYGYIARNRNVERCTEENCGYEIPAVPKDKDQIKLLQNLKLGEFKVAWMTRGIVFLVVVQLVSTYHAKFFRETRKAVNQKVLVVREFDRIVSSFSRTVFGITAHGVFMDSHFEDYNHIVAVTTTDDDGQEIWLPFIDERGHPGKYIRGCNWVNFTFRVNNRNVNNQALEEGLERYIQFWAGKENVNLDQRSFKVKVKKIDSPKDWDWEEDFLSKQIAKEWMDVGSIEFSGHSASFDIPIIEDI